MHLSIDHAGQYMQPGGVKNLASRGRGHVADGGDAPVTDANIAAANAVMGDQCAPAQQQIKWFNHMGLLCGRGQGLEYISLGFSAEDMAAMPQGIEQ